MIEINGVEVFAQIMLMVWDLLAWQVPGFQFTAQDLVVVLVLVNFSSLCVWIVFGFGAGSGQRSGQSRNPRISNERRGDTK